MRRATALVVALLIAVPAAPAGTTQPGFHVSGSKVLDANGRPFVMRGLNWGHNWFPDRSPAAFRDMRKAGANTIRVVFSDGRFVKSSAADVAGVIRRCRSLRLVCVLENHDTTSYGDDPKAYTLDQAVDFWLRIKQVLVGHEKHIVINIGNEPFGTTFAAAWTKATIKAVRRMRAAGLRHLLMVDAPDFGQDERLIMSASAPLVLQADPERNVLFDVHMYNVYGNATRVKAYVDAYLARDLPLVIGEFGGNSPYGDVDEQTIMSYAQERGIGWLAWSWSGNSPDAYLDVVKDFDPRRLTPWGRSVVHGPTGLLKTAQTVSVYR